VTQHLETDFEKPRGVSRVETRSGFAQIHVMGLQEPLVESRLKVLQSVADHDISIDFLKFTPNGLSFLVPSGRSDDLERALKAIGVTYTLEADRSIVMVHAVNMRDEEGLIAGVMAVAINAGARLDHASDMHDRMLLVASASDAERLVERFNSAYGESKVER
jgi:aspartokinase